MTLSGLILLTTAHVIVSIFVINRLHATALPYWLIKIIDLVWYLAVLSGMALLVMAVGTALLPQLPTLDLARLGLPERLQTLLDTLATSYATLVGIAGPAIAISWWVRRRIHCGERLMVDQTRRSVPLAVTPDGPSAADWTTRLFAAIPGNRVFDLMIQEKTLVVPNLPPSLAGLTIAHLSDLHFTGRTHIGYYREVVRLANEFRADYAVIAGDIIDKPECFPWLTDVLGQLQAQRGKFFVLGNHDLRVHDETRVRRSLESVGFQDLGGRAVFTDVDGTPILWAGNELPWFSPAADLTQVAHDSRSARAFRIAVSHSPDQFPWARANRFHLMLAGHTHGGQIRLPWFGAVFSPSRFGVLYASGTFFLPPTLLHVSRGLSGTRPIRIGCPPELTKLILQPAHVLPNAGPDHRTSQTVVSSR